MKKYAIVINEETKLCDVALGNPEAIYKVETLYKEIIDEETGEVRNEPYEVKTTVGEYYQSLGMTEQEVEKSYNGQWYLQGYAPTQPLDELKSLKREEINQARDNAEQGGFSYIGKVFDSDQVSCQRISCAAQAMSLMPASDETKITWTCQDNSTIDLTAQELSGLVVALANWSNECHQKATKLKAQIEACESAEELEKITWEDKPDILL